MCTCVPCMPHPPFITCVSFVFFFLRHSPLSICLSIFVFPVLTGHIFLLCVNAPPTHASRQMNSMYILVSVCACVYSTISIVFPSSSVFSGNELRFSGLKYAWMCFKLFLKFINYHKFGPIPMSGRCLPYLGQFVDVGYSRCF